MNRTRENAKYLMEIIDSPEIKKPDDWNIKFENNPSLNARVANSLNLKKSESKEKNLSI